MYNWITLLYSRNEHKIVNQLYLDKINFLEKESEDATQKKEKLQIKYMSLSLPLSWLVRERSSPPPELQECQNTRHLTQSRWDQQQLMSHEHSAQGGHLPCRATRGCMGSGRNHHELWSLTLCHQEDGCLLASWKACDWFIWIIPWVGRKLKPTTQE